MATATKRKINFFESEEGIAVKGRLQDMVANKAFNTDSSYSANGTQYPSHEIPFTDKHMNYLSSHPAIDPEQYVANLRLLTRYR